jgi:hypothetical protein
MNETMMKIAYIMLTVLRYLSPVSSVISPGVTGGKGARTVTLKIENFEK